MLHSLLVILMSTVVLTALNSTTSSAVVLMATPQSHIKSIPKLTIKHQNNPSYINSLF